MMRFQHISSASFLRDTTRGVCTLSALVEKSGGKSAQACYNTRRCVKLRVAWYQAPWYLPRYLEVRWYTVCIRYWCFSSCVRPSIFVLPGYTRVYSNGTKKTCKYNIYLASGTNSRCVSSPTILWCIYSCIWSLLKSCEIQLLSHTRYNISYIAWYNTLEERFNVKNTHISIIHHPSILGTNPTAATLNLTHRNRGYILTQQQYECCCCSCQECVSSSIHSWNKPNLSNVGLKTSKPGIKYITRYYTAAVLLYW